MKLICAKSSCILSLLLSFYVATSNGLYFHIGEAEKKCFLEEVPDDTMIVGIYKVEALDPQRNQWVATESGFGMTVEIKDPEGNVVLSRTYSAEGRFSYTAHVAGEHSICLHSNSTAWFGSAQLRVNLDFEIGDHAVDYQQLGTKEKLSELELRIRQLVDQTQQIQKEQTYQRTREERFRETSETINTRVFWWSIAQTVMLIMMGFWQMRHLKSFFIAKKLV